MKKITLFTAAMAAVSMLANAQSNWSVGLRTGTELSKSYNGTYDEKRTGLLMHQQLFVTKRLYKHLELELNTAYKSTITTTDFSNQIWDGPEYYGSTISYNTLEAGLALRYFVIEKNGWTPYVLGGVNANKQFMRYNSISKDPYKPLPDIVNQKSTMNNLLAECYIGIGLNKAIAKNWKLNAQLNVAYDCNEVYFSYYALNNFSPKAQVGLAYCW